MTGLRSDPDLQTNIPTYHQTNIPTKILCALRGASNLFRIIQEGICNSGYMMILDHFEDISYQLILDHFNDHERYWYPFGIATFGC